MEEILRMIFVSLLSGVSTLGGVAAYLYRKKEKLQESKDSKVDEERARADRLSKEAQERLDRLLKEQQQRLDQEHNDLMFATVRHYEDKIQIFEKLSGINRKRLDEETKKTHRIKNLSESQITEISSDLKKLLEKEKEDSNHDAT